MTEGVSLSEQMNFNQRHSLEESLRGSLLKIIQITQRKNSQFHFQQKSFALMMIRSHLHVTSLSDTVWEL